MNDQHDQMIAKVQHFSDKLKQIILEKESLALILRNGNLKEINKEISVYQNISDDYDEVFKNILFNEGE